LGRITSARERDALLHPARKLGRLGVLAPGQAHQLQRLGRLAVALLLADLALLEAVSDVVEHGHVREQGVGLEDRVDVAPVGRDPDRRAPADLDLAGARLVEARDHPQGRRLATARWPEQGEELTRMHLEVDVVDRDQIPETLRDSAQRDVRSLPSLHRADLTRRHTKNGPAWTTIWSSGAVVLCSPMAPFLALLLLLPLRGE
jgi:hypothetical protein